MLSGVEISVTTNNIIDVSWPRYFNTAVFWPTGGRVAVPFSDSWRIFPPFCPMLRQAAAEGMHHLLDLLPGWAPMGGACPWVTLSSRRWKSFGDLWNCYTIIYYIYILYIRIQYDL
jgi:hypothetical protein